MFRYEISKVPNKKTVSICHGAMEHFIQLVLVRIISSAFTDF